MSDADKKFVDPSPDYWDDYSNLQYVKHRLIENYLNGWFPKVGSFANRLLYFDTHAGKGTYKSGDIGSPLVAVNTLLNHHYKETLLQRCEVRYYFIEHDEENLASLNQELDKVTLPGKVFVETQCGDCFELLESLLATLKENKKRLAPAFVFIDPYTFKVPGSIFKELMEFPRVELFINVIWRELNMGLVQSDTPGWQNTFDYIFDKHDWRALLDIEDTDQRAEAVCDLYKSVTGAEWHTFIRMLGKNRATKYVLLHLTNHDAGRDLMKDCMWKLCPDGEFYARQSDDPRQGFLITPEPDLRKVDAWLEEMLRDEPQSWEELTEKLRPMPWLNKHLWQVIRDRRKAKTIEAEYEGRFSQKANPVFSLKE